MRLLAAREHSRAELQRKLHAKGFDAAGIESVLDDLQARRLLSDERFTEQYIAMRVRKGFGPLRIRAELGERGVSAKLVARQLDEADVDWRSQARRLRDARFGDQMPADRKAVARQARFLSQRGFPDSLVRDLLLRD